MSQAITRASIIASATRALLGEVSGDLRCVQVACRDARIDLYCYFDGEPSEQDVESMQIVGAMVVGDFPGHMVDEHCIRLDAPERIPHFQDRITVFLRKG